MVFFWQAYSLPAVATNMRQIDPSLKPQKRWMKIRQELKGERTGRILKDEVAKKQRKMSRRIKMKKMKRVRK